MKPKLYHISKNSNIVTFTPRILKRDNLNESKAVVLAIEEKHIPNYLVPKECSRLLYNASPKTTAEDINNFFSSKSSSSCIVIEHSSFNILKDTSLYLYEFDPELFYPYDENLGYWTSEVNQVPIKVFEITHPFEELILRNFEIRIIDNLLDLLDKMKNSSLEWFYQ